MSEDLRANPRHEEQSKPPSDTATDDGIEQTPLSIQGKEMPVDSGAPENPDQVDAPRDQNKENQQNLSKEENPSDGEQPRVGSADTASGEEGEAISGPLEDDSSQPAENKKGTEVTSPEPTDSPDDESEDDSKRPVDPGVETTIQSSEDAENARDQEEAQGAPVSSNPVDADPGVRRPHTGSDHPEKASAEAESKEAETGSKTEEETEVDFAHLSKTELVQVIEDLARSEDPERSYRQAREIRDLFNSKVEELKSELLKIFVDGGGEEDAFEYTPDDETNRFFANFNLLRDRRNQSRKRQIRSRDENLEVKQNILEQLRHLVDGEETNASMKALKDLQAEWKNTGPVPAPQAKTLWANYNALITRFYDNRSIYFELKELDRKKNLEAKIQVCEKAEALESVELIRDAVKELNELHEEFKHIGPVPMEQQDDIWARFKAASDKIYARRKAHYDGLKKEFSENYELKLKLIERLTVYLDFQSERITEWNAKTKEILALQKEWEAIGGLPRDKAKEVNKQFWSAFKKFFSNKSHFFKKLEGQRQKNLELKQELVAKAEEVKESQEWEKTAELLKQLQSQWREIGPVPENVKDKVYKQFKAACDTFFQNKRGQRKEVEKEFEENLKLKEDLCSEMEELIDKQDLGPDTMTKYMEKWESIGFVPRNAMKKIQTRFDGILDKLMTHAPDLDAEEISDLKLSIKLRKLNSGPNAQNKLFKRELHIKKQIGRLESDLSAWQTNLGYFSDSKNADILKNDFQEKIDKAGKELSELKKELQILYRM